MTLAPTPSRDDAREVRDCPRCGSATAPLQDYCLGCGTRLARDAGAGVVLASWRAASPWYAGEWVWPVLASFVVALLVGVVAVMVATADDDAPNANALVATVAQAAPPPTETVPAPTATVAPPEPPPTTTQQAPRRRRGELVRWPADADGFTVVLVSSPKDAGRAAAVAHARAAKRAGIPNVGVLDTDRFTSFHPGYYVVFSGILGSQAEADRAAEAAHDRGYESAYPRPVTR